MRVSEMIDGEETIYVITASKGKSRLRTMALGFALDSVKDAFRSNGYTVESAVPDSQAEPLLMVEAV